MSELEDIRDDQIRVIGSDVSKKPFLRAWWIMAFLLVVLSLLVLFFGRHNQRKRIPLQLQK